MGNHKHQLGNPHAPSFKKANAKTWAFRNTIASFLLFCFIPLLGCGVFLAKSSSVAQTAIEVIAITPATSNLAAGGTLQFAASTGGSPNASLLWTVNGVIGGGASAGTISSSGLYLAPTAGTSGELITIIAGI